MIKERRYYSVIPHENGLGFVAVEHIYKGGKKKRLWTSNNHCDESLCELEIKRRKATVKEVQNLDLSKKFVHKFLNYGHRDSLCER